MQPPAESDSYTVALEGFSAFERTALASFFRLAAQRSPAYHQVEEAGLSDFLIADADHAGALMSVRRGQRLGDTVFIGSHAPKGSSAWLPRPIDPMHIVRELDTLVQQRLALPVPPDSGLLPLDGLDEPTPTGVDLLLPEAPAAQLPLPRGGAGREVLVVEDSAIARQFLARRLQRFGYRVQALASGEEALDLLSQRSFDIAFLDVVLGPPGSVDGLRLCQQIKQRSAQPGGEPCRVLLVTGLNGSSDRVRGSLAGCDVYLTKPLLEADFIAALRKVDPAFEWFEETVPSV